jgi:hypothetical protein
MKYSKEDLTSLIQLRDDIDELIEEELIKYRLHKREQQKEYQRKYYLRKKSMIRQQYYDIVDNFTKKCNIQQGDIFVEF